MRIEIHYETEAERKRAVKPLIAEICRRLAPDHNCVYCERPISEFRLWLAAIDTELAEREESRLELAYEMWQWWELWDHGVEPQDAVTAALIMQPARIKPWPEHYVYHHNV